MPQRVNYEGFPSTRYDQYTFKLRNVLQFLDQHGYAPTFRDFRTFCRKHGLWDKERSPVTFSLVGITWDKKVVKVGKLARKLSGLRDDEAFKRALYEELKHQNILLIKYVFEALDVESGGRLHSVHELYRMVTSYVYPGEYITLINFQWWIDWLAASGYIKLVGIRWALSDDGLEQVRELRQIDLEEILEDLEAEAEEGEAEDDEEAESEAAESPAAATSGAAPSPAAAPMPPTIDDGEDLFADLPPEPTRPSEEQVRAAAAAFGEDFDDVPGGVDGLDGLDGLDVAPAARARAAGSGRGVGAAGAVVARGLHGPLAAPGFAPVSSVDVEDGETQTLVTKINMWHAALGSWPAFTAEAFDVTVNAEASDLAIMVELATLAILIEGLTPQPQVFAFVSRLGTAQFFEKLGHGEGLEAALDAMERTGQEPWARALFERLIHARFIARRAAMKIDLLPALKAAKDGAEVIGLLREHLVGEQWVEAPFWIARELVRLGVLEGDAAKSVVVVPTAKLIANANRIGLANTQDFRRFDALLALSQEASKLFGDPMAGYGASLENLDRALGLRR